MRAIAIVPATGPEWTVRTGACRASALVIAPPAHCANWTKPSNLRRCAPSWIRSTYSTMSGPMYEFMTAVVVRSNSPDRRDSSELHEMNRSGATSAAISAPAAHGPGS